MQYVLDTTNGTAQTNTNNEFLPRYIATLAYHQIQLDPKGGIMMVYGG
jgi:hypothetical protein